MQPEPPFRSPSLTLRLGGDAAALANGPPQLLRVERQAPRPPGPATKSALLAGVIVLMSLSGGLLWTLGYNYDGLSGSPLTKLHPFTYLIFALLVWRAHGSGAPVVWMRNKIARRPAAVTLMAASLTLVIVTVLKAGPGMAGFIDTFAGPGAFALLLDDLDEADLRALRGALHVMLALNAAMALFEFASSHVFFPFRLDGVANIYDTRSTALQGHPLVNAALTSVYVVSLMAGGKGLSPTLRVGMILLQFAALCVFGGRTGIIVALALAPFYGVYALARVVARGRVSLIGAAAAATAVPLLGLAVAGALASGLADKLLMRFVDDNGSAATRVIMFDMLRPFGWSELLMGPDLAYVQTLRVHFGLENGVENPFVRMTLYQGGLMTAAVFLCLVWFFREVVRGRGWALLGPLLAMAVLLNASESIAVKTNFLDKLLLVFVCLFPLRPQPSPRAATSAGSSLRVASSIRPKLSNRHQKAHANPLASALSRTSRT